LGGTGTRTGTGTDRIGLDRTGPGRIDRTGQTGPTDSKLQFGKPMGSNTI